MTMWVRSLGCIGGVDLSLYWSAPLCNLLTGRCRSNTNVSGFLLCVNSILVGGVDPMQILVGFSSVHSPYWKVGSNNALVNWFGSGFIWWGFRAIVFFYV
jgi:hypothetical protein